MNNAASLQPLYGTTKSAENPDGSATDGKAHVPSQEKRWWEGYGVRRLSHQSSPDLTDRVVRAGPCQRDVSYKPYVMNSPSDDTSGEV